jgi:branched-chain amino acid transport system substrate-binding protein
MSACATTAGQAEHETVVIAADLELSGDGARMGAIFRNALELRVEQINRQGELGDRHLDLVVRDNRTDSGTAAANLASFASDPSVTAVITGACASCVLAGVERLNTAGLPTISLTADDSVNTPVEDRRYIFRLGPNATDTANALVLELDRAGVGSVAVIATNDAYGSSGVEHIASAAGRAGIEIAITRQLATDTDGVTEVAGEIIELMTQAEDLTFPDLASPDGLDAVIVWGYTPFASNVATALKGAGYHGPLYLDLGAAEELFLTGASGAAFAGATMIFTETMVIDEVIATSPAKAARKAWFNDYSARYGTYHGFASFAADAVDLIVEAINLADSTDRDAIRTALESVQMDGLTGPLRITPENHSGLLPQALTTLVARGDRWRLAG